MLNQIDLKYFKCFELLKLPLCPLTLLSGPNGSGKSSVLQSLVLLHQTIREHEWSTRLMLNGPFIRMGTVSDVVDKVHGRKILELGIMDDGTTYKWSFSGERSEMSMTVDCVSVRGKDYNSPKTLHYLLPPEEENCKTSLPSRLGGLTYTTAERVGPREVYTLEDKQIASVVGPAGEYAVSLLHWGRDENVIRGLLLDGVPTTLLRQVEERMRRFFPGFTLEVQQIPQANSVTLGIRTSEDTDFNRPIHVGFGLTQVLPIVVAALSAKEGTILLVENPEVHLHPAGQSLMGQFLADVARAGIQVIIETHSDHILNGIRKSVKMKRIKPEEVAIHFFGFSPEKTTQAISPQLDNDGNIDAWPDGFFDQFDKDMNYFAGWRE